MFLSHEADTPCMDADWIAMEGKTALIIENDAIIRECIQVMYESEGLDVISAHDGETGFDHADQSHPVLLGPSSASAVAKASRDSAETGKSDCHLGDGLKDAGRFQVPAAQRIGVQRPATALAGADPAQEVCRQTATRVNSAALLVGRWNAWLDLASSSAENPALRRADAKSRW